MAKPVHLHIDVELQGKYHPGYPIEKRGIYNLARMISSQLEVVNPNTNYNKLEKAYCIFICVGNIPKYLWNTVSYYEFANTKNIGKVETSPEDYDLMGLIMIRIGEKLGEEITDIVRFLHGIFYDTKEVDEYIDFSENEKFRKEMGSLAITGEHLIVYGQHMEQERTQKEKERADKAEARVKESEARVKESEARVKESEARVKEADLRTKELEKNQEEMKREFERNQEEMKREFERNQEKMRQELEQKNNKNLRESVKRMLDQGAAIEFVRKIFPELSEEEIETLR